MHCPVQVHLIADKILRNKLVVTEFVGEHNHLTDRNFFDILPRTRKRKLKDEEDNGDLRALLEAGVKTCKVRAILRKKGIERINAADIANLKYVLLFSCCFFPMLSTR